MYLKFRGGTGTILSAEEERTESALRRKDLVVAISTKFIDSCGFTVIVRCQRRDLE